MKKSVINFGEFALIFLNVLMNTLNWNLDKREFQNVEITQVQFVKGTTDLSDSSERLRLLVLSHQISQFGIPAFFLEKSPNYVKENHVSNPVVIIFDFEKKMQFFSLPSFFSVTSFSTNFESTFINEMNDHIQRAVILFYYYKFYDLSPLYHSSFLLFPCTESWHEPFILQYIPTKFQGRLRFRVLILSGLDIQFDSQDILEEQSIILIPPFEHPFLVVSSTETQITVQYVDKSIHTFQLNDIKFSHILNPSPSLLDVFQDIKTIKSIISPSSENFSQISNTNSKSFFLSDNEINDFFEEKIELSQKKEMEELRIESSELKDLPASIDVILTEQVLDQNLREQISDTLKPLCSFPSKLQEVKLSITPYNTFYERNYGITNYAIPKMAKSIYSKTSVHCMKIEIPNVIVSQKSQIYEISANDVINSWVSDSLRPISGQKDAHFIVFADSVLKENHTKQFFSHLSHVYSLLGFGKLIVYPKTSAFCFSNPEDITNSVSSFSNNNQLLEFTSFPTIIFVIAKREFPNMIRPNMLTIFISTHNVNICTFDYLKQLSFLIYSRIRMPSANLHLQIDSLLQPQNTQKFRPLDIFFGFRYQPPFLLQRIKENVLVLHVFWDPVSNESVWTDDTGSTLHAAKIGSLLEISSAFNELKNVFNEIKVILSVGLIVKSVSPKLIEPIKHISDINIYTILPAPFIQVQYPFKTDEDGIIFSDYEQISNVSDFDMKPLVSCYVVSRRFPAYYLSLYYSSDPNYTETLKSIAINLSNLSWLSVRPGHEKRTIGYPPGFNLILQKIPANSSAVNKFEFLPYDDQL